jgi:hypothetical protein
MVMVALPSLVVPVVFLALVYVLDHSTVSMSPGSNTIEGNGKVGGTVEQVLVDGTSAG